MNDRSVRRLDGSGPDRESSFDVLVVAHARAVGAIIVHQTLRRFFDIRMLLEHSLDITDDTFEATGQQ